ncbi:MAG: hypothetical protein ACLQU3_18575 [Limisphaerales bacterium]
MPLLASIYALTVSVVSVDSLYDKIRAREPAWYALLDLAADASAIVMFVAYWSKSLIHTIGGIAPYLFLFSLLWTLCSAPHELRFCERTMTAGERRFWGRLGGRFTICFGSFLLASPLFVFGGVAAFKQL